MFKFDEYPEIGEAHLKRERFLKKQINAEKKIRPNDEASKLPFRKVHDELVEFTQFKFALLIYYTFKDIKPRLYNRVKDCFAKWEEVFPDKWEECNEVARNHLLGLVLELGFGQYWLPDEYYDDKPIDGCLPPPPTHTKPWGFGFM